MLYREILNILSRYLFLFSLLLLIPLAVAYLYEFHFDITKTYLDHSTRSFVFTIVITLILALLLKNFGRKATGKLRRKEGIFLVICIWVITSIIGALPFLFTKTLTNPIDALFESVSGFTTTGSSIIYPKAYNDKGEEIPITMNVTSQPDASYQFYGTIAPIINPETGQEYKGFDAISRPILFWRSFSQWIGGMGIIIFFLSILPMLGIGGKFLYEAGFPEDFPGSFQEKIKPRVQETSRVLLKTYIGLTILQIIFLMLLNEDISLFEAAITTFSTLSTGGFTVKQQSIASFHNASTEWIVMLFMIFGGINYSLYFFLIRGKFRKFLEPEFLIYCFTFLFICLLIVWQLNPWIPESFRTFLNSVRPAFFQGISAMTTTGFYTENYDAWPIGAQALMLMGMYIGGMTGSTSSGIKIGRHLILFKAVAHRMEKLFRPESIRTLTLGEKEVPQQHVINVFCFMAILIIVAALGTLLFIFNGIDFATAFGLIACAINNVGFAFRAAGPEGTCAILPIFSKIVMIIWMFLGRLEFFAFIVLILPSFWKKK
ncbi:MAG: TrkH family potassium uptake protein [Simkaniaceae bacterium]